MKKLQKIILLTFMIGGMLTITFLTQSQVPVKSSSSTNYVNILPYIYAGPDMAICNDIQFQTQGIAPLEGTINWVTNGDGIFDNPHNPTTYYTPGELDIATGQVTLTLHLIPQVITQNPMKDEVTIYLNACVYPKLDEQ